MKGHIRERSPGRWAIVLDVIDPATGKRRRKWHSFSGTKRQAETECARLITAQQTGTYAEPNKLTVAEFLERWLTHVKPNVSPRTFERYAEIARKNLTPLLGAKLLTKLQPINVSDAYAEALNNGRRDGKGGLSPRTVHHLHRVLHQALRQAVRWGLLSRNPADLDRKDRPKIERKPVATVDADETAAILDEARARRLFIPIVLGSMCGLRRGEITALRWHSIDLDRRQLAVVASTEQTRTAVREKDAKGSKCRTLALPAYVVDELKRHRAAQAQELLRVGFRLDADTHVVTQEDGRPLQPNSLTHAVTLFMKGRGGRLRLHGLRHSHASHMLKANVHPKIVQERFGHSSIAITMDIYSHLMPNMQEDAAAKVDEALQAAIGRRPKPAG
jgi:integrase